MSRRAELWGFIILGIVVLIVAIFAIRLSDNNSKAELILDEKASIIREYYGMGPVRTSIVDRKGGYDESTGRYHYEFIIQKDSVPYAVIIYDDVEDLTKETVDRVHAEHPEDVFKKDG